MLQLYGYRLLRVGRQWTTMRTRTSAADATPPTTAAARKPLSRNVLLTLIGGSVGATLLLAADDGAHPLQRLSFAAGGTGTTGTAAPTSAGGLHAVLAEADRMYDNPQTFSRPQLHAALSGVDLGPLDGPARAEVLWRLARAAFSLREQPGLAKDAKAKRVKEAYALIQVLMAIC